MPVVIKSSQKILESVWAKKPTVPLYHYTTQSGLIGIVSKQEIWATHTQYLNDHREVKHALEMAEEEMDAMAKSDDSLKPYLETMKDGLYGLEGANVCVCSFSEERDSLSQWRAYGAKTSGFSLGFSHEHLLKVANLSGLHLAKCIYDEDEQIDLIRAVIRKALKENIARKKKKTASEDELPPAGNFASYMHAYAPIIKHPSFREEKEWRFVSKPRSSRSKSYDFREGNSMLIPYSKVSMKDEDGVFSLVRVMIGPTPHPAQSRLSVKSFLSSKGLKQVMVTATKVPYRSW